MLSATSPVCRVPGRAAASFIGGDEVSPNLKDLVSNSHLLECRVRFIHLFELFLRSLFQRSGYVRIDPDARLAPVGDAPRQSRPASLRVRAPEWTARFHVVSYAVLAVFEPSRHMFTNASLSG